ncbi:hypothetical protein I6E17_02110 [Fusobacterium perfoetens]|uniref:YopX family protein n=1 Tax=Fusobacterium perfoetens TaxID=852 RepID=UPI001F489B00|nr:YopX family protein [Fusobacterium perfoetens]MCF2624970.1 hypothetical protein [Fusobacterium perfoetens]
MKYRVWDKKEKQFIENVFVMPNGRLLMFTNYHSFNSEWDFIDDEGRYIILECSGFKDKNGKYIYNGDIIKYTFIKKSFFYEVEYNDSWLLSNKYENVNISFAFKSRLEIIGNIYENPELLENIRGGLSD